MRLLLLLMRHDFLAALDAAAASTASAAASLAHHAALYPSGSPQGNRMARPFSITGEDPGGQGEKVYTEQHSDYYSLYVRAFLFYVFSSSFSFYWNKELFLFLF